MNKLPISPLEYSALKEELDKCQREKMERGKQLGEVMATSGSFAAKTPGYSETENAIRVLDAKIDQLQSILNSTVQIHGVDELPKERIGVYSRVVAEDENGEVKTYYICHLPSICQHADSLAVTSRSPVGQALIGKMRGAVVELALPRGRVELTIISHESVL